MISSHAPRAAARSNRILPIARERTTPRRTLLKVALSTTFLFVLLEVVLAVFLVRDGRLGERPLPPFGAWNTPRQEQQLEHRRTKLAEGRPRGNEIGSWSAELGWDLFPNALAWNGARTNSWGARGQREYPDAKPADTTRILCFGESFTFCEDVVDEDTWPHQLEHRRVDWEVVNFGVGAYGTDQALLRFRRDAPGREADVICLGIMLENLHRNVNRYRPLYYPSSMVIGCKPRFRLEAGELVLVPVPYTSELEFLDAVHSGSVLADLAQHEYWTPYELGPLRWSRTARLAAAWPAYAARQHEVSWKDPDCEPFRVTLAIALAFHREALALGAHLAPVLIFPAEDDLVGDDRYWSAFLDALDREGVAWLDLCPALREAAARAPGGHRELMAGGHFNRAGNAVIAATLDTWLTERLR